LSDDGVSRLHLVVTVRLEAQSIVSGGAFFADVGQYCPELLKIYVIVGK